MVFSFNVRKLEGVVPKTCSGFSHGIHLTSFPSPAVNRKAKKFLKKGLVKPVPGSGVLGLRFEVGTTPQTVVRKSGGGGYVCSCEHYAVHKDDGCSHIWSVILWFKGWNLKDEGDV